MRSIRFYPVLSSFVRVANLTLGYYTKRFSPRKKFLLTSPVAFSLFGLCKKDKHVDSALESDSLSLLDKADLLFQQGNFEEAISILESREKEDFEELWRLGYAKWAIGRSEKVSEKQNKLLNEAHVHACAAYKLNPDHFATNKVMGLTLGEMKVNAFSKMRNSKQVFQYFQRAIDLNPKDAESHYFLGSICFVVCVIPSALKATAGVFVSLPKSSFEEALSHFKMAEDLQPNFTCRNQMAISKTYQRLNMLPEAVFWMRRASEFPVKTEKDGRDKTEAQDVIAKWSSDAKFKDLL